MDRQKMLSFPLPICKDQPAYFEAMFSAFHSHHAQLSYQEITSFLNRK